MVDYTPLPRGPAAPAAVQLARWVFAPAEFLQTCHRRFGDRFTLRVPGFGDPLVMLSDPDGVRDLMTAPSATVRGAKQSMRPILDDASLLLIDGPEHAQARKLMGGPFQGARVHTHAAMITECTDRMLDGWRTGTTKLMHPALLELALEVVVAALFGCESRETQARLAKLYLRASALPSKPYMSLQLVRKDLGPLSPWGAFLRRKRELDEAVLEIVRRRRRLQTPGDDAVGEMIAARREDGSEMSDSEACTQTRSLLITGEDTSATMMAWTLSWLTREPHVLVQLQDLVRAQPSVAAQTSLPLLDATLKEVMRLSPLVPVLLRRLDSDTNVGGMSLPAGTMLGACAYLAQRRSQIFPDPERFLPERFLGVRFSPYAYFPFGVGRRMCLGQPFAMQEQKLVLARILDRVDFSSPDTRPVRAIRRAILLAPAGKVPLTINRVREVSTSTQ